MYGFTVDTRTYIYVFTMVAFDKVILMAGAWGDRDMTRVSDIYKVG